MDGLCVLIDADIWLWGLSCQTVPGAPQVYVNFTVGGMSDEQFPRLLKAIDHPDMSWVVAGFFKELSEKKTHLTRLRQQIVSDEVFCQSEAYSFWKDADIAAVFMSVRPLDEQSGSTVGIYRRFGRPRFTQRESKIAPIILT